MITATIAIVITLLWTGICSVGLGFCLRGYAFARRGVTNVKPLDGIALRQARRNLRVERVRVLCQVFGLIVGFLALGSRAGVVPVIITQVGSTVFLIGIAVALMVDSILDDKYRGDVEREEIRLLAVAVSPVVGGQRKYDPPAEAPDHDKPVE